MATTGKVPTLGFGASSVGFVVLLGFGPLHAASHPVLELTAYAARTTDLSVLAARITDLSIVALPTEET